MDIKALRKAAGLTQLELSEKVGVSRSMISLYEMGITNPSVKVLVKLAEIFKSDLNQMKRTSPPTTPAPEAESGEKSLRRQIDTVMKKLERCQAEETKLQQELRELLAKAAL